MKGLVIKAAVMAAIFFAPSGLHGQDFKLEKHLLSSGGDAAMKGGQFSLSGSVGQVTTEKSEGGTWSVQAGFWQMNNDLIFENEFE